MSAILWPVYCDWPKTMCKLIRKNTSVEKDMWEHIERLLQWRLNSSALEMELRLSCINSLIVLASALLLWWNYHDGYSLVCGICVKLEKHHLNRSMECGQTKEWAHYSYNTQGCCGVHDWVSIHIGGSEGNGHIATLLRRICEFHT